MSKVSESGAAPRSPTEQELQELERALRAATPAPWGTERCGPDDDPRIMVVGPEHFGFNGDDSNDVCRDVSTTENAEAIAALRNVAPALLAEVRRLRARVAYLEMPEGERRTMDTRAAMQNAGVRALTGVWAENHAVRPPPGDEGTP